MKWFAAAALTLMLASPADAQMTRDPDWPCQAIKVPQLSLATVWAGPSVTDYLTRWSSDPQVADLAAALAQRRVPLDEAQARISAFAASSGSARGAKLLALMAGLFETLDAERSSVVAGLDRFGRRQKELAADIRSEAETLRQQQASATSADQGRIEALTQQLGWDTRVFEDRRQSVSAACDVLNMIEQRLYRLAQVVHELL